MQETLEAGPTPPTPPTLPQRMIVVGDSGSGKSTLAARIARAIDAPFIELDALHWKPNWVESSDDELRPKLEAAAATERWVAAGNYGRVSRGTLWPRAEVIVWIDLPLTTVLPRLMRRTYLRWKTHELLWGTNYEDWRNHVGLWERDNLFHFMLRNHGPRRKNYAAFMAGNEFTQARWVRLCTPREIEAFVDTLQVERERTVAR